MAMNVEQLCALFQATLQPNQDVRKEAEQTLKAVSNDFFLGGKDIIKSSMVL